MGATYLCRHTLKSPPTVSDCLLFLVRLHKEPHEQHSNQDNHEVEEKFLCGSLHFWGIIRREQRSAGRTKGKLQWIAQERPGAQPSGHRLFKGIKKNM